jgi:hypothetical protein
MTTQVGAHSSGDGARSGTDAYLSSVAAVGTKPSSDPAIAQLRLDVVGTVSSALRCGHKTLDIELVVISRSLYRLRKHYREDQAALFELRVVQQSLSRITKVLRALHVKSADSATEDMFDATTQSSADGRRVVGDGDEDDDDDDAVDESGGGHRATDACSGERLETSTSPLTQPSNGIGALVAAAGPREMARGESIAVGSPARMLLSSPSGGRRQRLANGTAGKRKGVGQDEEMKALRAAAHGGLWHTVVTTARHGKGEYLLLLDPEDVKAHAYELLRDAPAFGFSNLANRLVMTAKPQIRVANFPAQAIGSISGLADAKASEVERIRSAFLASAPPGVVDFVKRRGLQCTPTAGSAWGAHKVATIIEKGATPFMTQPNEDAWINIDFFNVLVMPTAYGFSSFHHIIPGCFPRSWQLLGSLDGTEWTVLADHDDDESFRPSSQTVVFPVRAERDPTAASSSVHQRSTNVAKGASAPIKPDPQSHTLQGVYRHLRLVQRGPNSSGTLELQAHGLEVYGNVIYVQPDEGTSTNLAGPIRRTVPPIEPPPPVDVSAKKAAKKK